MEAVKVSTLDSNWSWKQRDSSVTSVLDELETSVVDESDSQVDTKAAWRYAQTFPSEVHVELLKAGLIPDPYIGFNEHRVQCTCVHVILFII